jgi:hypothetical protein
MSTPRQKNITSEHEMLTLDEIRQALKDRRPGMVAQATGLHLNTVRDVRDSKSVNPSYKVLKALSDYLTGATQEAGTNG